MDQIFPPSKKKAPLKTALNENQNTFLSEMLESLNDNKNTKKIAFIQPEGAEEVIIATSLIPSIKNLYPGMIDSGTTSRGLIK